MIYSTFMCPNCGCETDLELGYTLQQMLDVWAAGRKSGVEEVKEYNGAVYDDSIPDKKEYFKEKFNIIL